MNQNHKRKPLLLLFLILTSLVNSQTKKNSKEGIIYLSNGDALKGNIALSTVYFGVQKKNPRVFYWKSSEDKKRSSYKAKLVDSITISNDKTYYSLFIKNSKQKDFFSIIYDDEVSLITKRQVKAGHFNKDFGYMPGGKSDDEFWIWDTNGIMAYPLSETTSWGRSFKSYSRETLKKCPSLVKKIEKKELKKKDILTIIKYYNGCLNN